MKIIRTLSTTVSRFKQAVLTIGNFDGVHRGHQAVLNRVKEISRNSDQLSCVFTFDNDPSEVLHPGNRKSRLCSLDHKIHLLEQAGIDLLLLLSFTPEFSQQSAEDFLLKLHTALPFSSLVLGYDAALGRNREGDRERVGACAQSLGFNLEYIDQFYYEGIAVSSTVLRRVILQGDLDQAEKLLSRKYSIYGRALLCQDVQGNHTAISLNISGLCLPPSGIYPINLLYDKKLLKGEAHLGTSQESLRVIIFGKHLELASQYVEVIF